MGIFCKFGSVEASRPVTMKGGAGQRLDDWIGRLAKVLRLGCCELERTDPSVRYGGQQWLVPFSGGRGAFEHATAHPRAQSGPGCPDVSGSRPGHCRPSFRSHRLRSRGIEKDLLQSRGGCGAARRQPEERAAAFGIQEGMQHIHTHINHQ